MPVIHVTDQNFNTEVLGAERTVLIDFWAAWCGPCQALMPVIEELSKESVETKICKINVDEQPELAAEFNIMSIPTLVLMKNGKIVKTSVGVKSKLELLSMIHN